VHLLDIKMLVIDARCKHEDTLQVLIHFFGPGKFVNDNAFSQGIRLTELLEFLCCKYFDGLEIFRHASITPMSPSPLPSVKESFRERHYFVIHLSPFASAWRPEHGK